MIFKSISGGGLASDFVFKGIIALSSFSPGHLGIRAPNAFIELPYIFGLAPYAFSGLV